MASADLEHLTDGLELIGLLTFQFRADFVKLPDHVERIDPLSAMEAYFRGNGNRCSVTAASQQLLDLPFHDFSTADWTFLEWCHDLALRCRQLSHR